MNTTSFLFFLGIDLSKLKIDVCLIDVNYPKTGKKAVFENNTEGFRTMQKWLRERGYELKKGIFGMEYTGVYGVGICEWLTKKKCSVVVEPARQIQHSIGGFHRGKEDQVDAFRIARYLYLHRDELNFYQLPDKLISQIKYLLSYRDRLIKSKVSLELPLKEIGNFDPETAKIMLASSQEVVSGLKEKIKEVDQQLEELVKKDDELQNNYKLLRSVTGIGPQTALYMLVVTQNFVSFPSARKFACYSGVAPFPHQSGSSVKGKTKVSHLANKKAARSAIRYDNQLKRYYQRKRKEGKCHLIVLNAVRNKIIARAFATIKRQSDYVALANFAA